MTRDLRKRNYKNITIDRLPTSLVLGLSFLLPCLGYLLVMMFRGVVPFSDDTAFIYSDSYYQYYPFFKEFRRALLSGDGLLYTWSVGMGMDYLGLISYYLASPLNWLVVLIPESWTFEFFCLLVPIRLGLAGLSFATFLKWSFQKSDLSIVAFSCLYGTCAWALGYQWNLMWLDTFALLPLVVLGFCALMKHKKFILYTITLFLSIFSNYYIGYFTCIFVLLLFIGYQICNFTTFRRFCGDLGRIALFSILAIGMTAILELPALAALNNTSSMTAAGSAQVEQSLLDKIPREFRLNMVEWSKYSAANGAYTAMMDGLAAKDYAEVWNSFLVMIKAVWAGLSDGFVKVFGNVGGGLTPNFVSDTGLPNIYCGVGAIYMACLFLTTTGIKIREKICSVLMLMFLTLSFLLRPLDYIWHGFHFPNMIPYRYSFLFSFVMLYMAYRAFLQRHKLQAWQLAFAALLTCALFYCSKNRNENLFIVFNLVFFLLYVGIFCFSLIRRKAPESGNREAQRKHLVVGIWQKRIVSIAMSIVIFVETGLSLANFGSQYPSYSVASYPKGGQEAESIVAIMKEIENRELFYRTETTHCQLYNDGAMLDYNGISTFSSSADVDTTVFLKSLGLGAAATWNRYAYEQTSPVTNLFLNLKYMIERTRHTFPQNSYFAPVYNVGSVTLLENNAYLPLGFLAQPQLANTAIDLTGDRFGLQNQLLKDAAGIEAGVWQKQQGNLMINGHNVTVTNKTGSGACRFNNGQSAYRCTVCSTVGTKAGACDACGGLINTGVYVTYTYTAQQTGLFCIDLMGSSQENIQNAPYFTAKHNGNLVMNQENVDTLTQMVSLCDVNQGDIIELTFQCNQGQSGRIHVQAAILDETVFREAYDILNTSTLKLTTFENTFIEGYIDCHQDGLLYTSIPDNGSWVAYVDGKEVPIVVIGNAMVGVSLSQGKHTVTFRYENKAFTLGLWVSVVCLLAFVAICVVFYKKPAIKGKYEK